MTEPKLNRNQRPTDKTERIKFQILILRSDSRNGKGTAKKTCRFGS